MMLRLISMPYLYMSNGKDTCHRHASPTVFMSLAPMNTEYNDLFVSGRFELVEGSHITDDMPNGIILSKELC